MTRSRGMETAGVVALILALALGAWLLVRGGERELNLSAIGHDGLLTWLKQDGIEARKAVAVAVEPDSVGLRILPIYDTDLGTRFERPETREDYLKTTTEIDITQVVVQRKLNLLPTLIIAPKWTRAMRQSGFAHPSLLTDLKDASRPFEDTAVAWKPFVRPERQVLELRGMVDPFEDLTVTLYAPQLFDPTLPPNCVPVIGGRLGHVMIRCKGARMTYHAISDPDMLNNHGLTLGDNAETARVVLPYLADGKTVLLDNTTRVFVERERQYDARDWSDLLRFFSYPFSVLWIGLAALLGLAVWRSSVRFGPAQRPFDDQPSAARAVSVKAKARLLQLTGNRQALIAAHVHNRLHELSTALLGSERGANARQLQNTITRKNPELARDFVNSLDASLSPPAGASAAQILDLLEAFEAETQKVLHEFGRT